jgi:hypothetical protein
MRKLLKVRRNIFLRVLELVEIVLQLLQVISNVDTQVHVVLFYKYDTSAMLIPRSMFFFPYKYDTSAILILRSHVVLLQM